MNQFLYEQSPQTTNYPKADFAFFPSYMKHNFNNQKICTSNDEIFHQEKELCSFLRKKSSNNLTTFDSDYNKENIPDYLDSFAKKNLFFDKQKKPLKEIKFNELHNKAIKNLDDSFSNILQISINEKKQIDKEEREKKKLNKIYMLKIQQKYKQFNKNDRMIEY